jgi:DNA-binding HxlR family transcriptional regulator
MRILKTNRSVCPITNLLDIAGDKWTLLVIRDLLLGKKRFAEFAESDEKIPTNILANRLKRMEKLDLLKKNPYQNNPVRFEYTLTEKGKALKPIIREMARWGLQYVDGTKTFTRVQSKL